MLKPDSVVENETHKTLWDFGIPKPRPEDLT